MSDHAEIEHTESESGGMFFVERGGARVAEMTYRRTSPTLVVIDHTEVTEVLRGRGFARKLLDGLATWARSSGQRVGATCSYAAGELQRDATLRDLRPEPTP